MARTPLARSLSLRTAAGLVALALSTSLLSACGGEEADPDAAAETPTSPTSDLQTDATDPATEDPTDGATEEPDALTEPGTPLVFGEPARVEFQPKAKNAKATELELTVRRAQRGRISDLEGFDLDTPYKRKAHYYYVRVSVENVGERRVGGDPVPLWGLSGANTLLPPVRLTSSFAKCPSESMPDRFRPGDSFTTCLVFLSPDKGSLEGVSYRPDEDFTPIVWTGPVKGPAKVAKKDAG